MELSEERKAWWCRNLEWNKDVEKPDVFNPWFCFDVVTKRVLATLYLSGGMWNLFFEDAGYGSMPGPSRWVDPENPMNYVLGTYSMIEGRDRAEAERVHEIQQQAIRMPGYLPCL